MDTLASKISSTFYGHGLKLKLNFNELIEMSPFECMDLKSLFDNYESVLKNEDAIYKSVFRDLVVGLLKTEENEKQLKKAIENDKIFCDLCYFIKTELAPMQLVEKEG